MAPECPQFNQNDPFKQRHIFLKIHLAGTAEAGGGEHPEDREKSEKTRPPERERIQENLTDTLSGVVKDGSSAARGLVRRHVDDRLGLMKEHMDDSDEELAPSPSRASRTSGPSRSAGRVSRRPETHRSIQEYERIFNDGGDIRKIDLNREHFAHQNVFDHIENLAYLGSTGREAQQILMEMADIRANFTGQNTDALTVWRRIVNDPNRMTINANEIAMAVYGKPMPKLFKLHEKWKRDREKRHDALEMLAFFDLADRLMNLLPETEDTGTTYEGYQEMMEEAYWNRIESDEGFEERAFFVETFFKHDGKIPIRGSRRHELTERTFTRVVSSTGRRAERRRGYELYHESEFASHTNIFAEVVDAEDPLALINQYLVMGSPYAANLVDTSKRRGERNLPGEIPLLTEEDFTNPDYITEAQIAAVRHGAQMMAGEEAGVIDRVRRKPDYNPTLAEPKRGRERRDSAGIDTAATDMVEAITQEMDLSPEEAQDLRNKIEHGLRLSYTMLVAKSLDGTAKENWELKAALGFKHDLPHGLTLTYIEAEAGVLLPALVATATLRSGVQWTSKRFGKKKLLQGGVFAYAGWSPTHIGEVGEAKLNVGAYLRSDLLRRRADGKVRRSGLGAMAGAQATAGLGLRGGAELIGTLNAGFERDFDVELENRIDDYYFENRVDIAAARQEIKNSVASSIPETDPIGRASMEDAANNYLDLVIRKINIDAYTKGIKAVKFKGIGLTFSAGVKLDPVNGNAFAGMSLGIYGSIGILKPRTFYYKPNSARHNRELYFETPETDYDYIQVKSTYLWETAEEETEAYERAKTDTRTAVGVLSEQLDAATLTQGEQFTSITLEDDEKLGLRGNIRVFVDGRSTVPLIYQFNESTNQLELAVNYGTEDKHFVVYSDQNKTNFGTDTTDFFITTVEDASIEDVINNSPNVLTWNAFGGGQNSSPNVSRNALAKTGAPNNENILTQTRALTRAYDESDEFELKDLSINGSRQLLEQITVTERNIEGTVRNYGLFEELYPEREAIQAVADQLVASGMTYEQLSLGDYQDETFQKIVRLYLKNGYTDEQITSVHVLMAHQLAMTKRVPHQYLPEAWNRHAFASFAGDEHGIQMEYFKAHEEEILAQDESIMMELPMGAEMAVFINDRGLKNMYPYYDPTIHGKLRGGIDWARSDDELMEQLGMENNDESRTQLSEMRQSVLTYSDWPEPPFADLNNPTFDEAVFTTMGMNLVKDIFAKRLTADYILNNEEATQLYEIFETGNISANPALAAEFAEAIGKLYRTGEAQLRGVQLTAEMSIYSGLYDHCMNLAIARHYTLAYKRTEVTRSGEEASDREMAAGGSQNTINAALGLTEGFHETRIDIAPIGTPIHVPGVRTPSEIGSGEQIALEEGQTPDDLAGQSPSGSQNETTQPTDDNGTSF